MGEIDRPKITSDRIDVTATNPSPANQNKQTQRDKMRFKDFIVFTGVRWYTSYVLGNHNCLFT